MTGRRTGSARRVVTAVLATLGCAFAVASCDSGFDACDLLSNAAAADVLGVPVHDGELDTDRTIPATHCRWVAEGSDRSEGADAPYEVGWTTRSSSVRR